MSEQRTTPAPLRGLRLLSADTDTDTGVGGDTAPDTKGDTRADTQGDAAPTPVSVSGAEMVPLSAPDRIRLWVDAARRIAREVWAPCGRALDRLWHPEPETMREHQAYIRSVAWVPPELSGRKSGTAIAFAGIAYHALIAVPVKSAMKAVVKAAMNIDRDAERPLRMLMLAVFISAFVLVLLHL